MPKLAQRKAKKLLELLRENGLHWSEYGILTSKPSELEDATDIVPLVKYAIRGKDKPSSWDTFALFLSGLKIPKDTLCASAVRDLKRAKKNAK